MRDRKAFEALLQSVLDGAKADPAAFEPFRDRASVLITDLSGFTRLTRELGLEGMMALLYGMRKTALPLLREFGGVLVKYEADDLFAAFPSPLEALSCADALRRAFADPALRLPAKVELCMGIGWGDILWWGEGDLYGEEVNLASKLGEDTAEANEILLTAAARGEAQRARPDLRFEPMPSIRVGGKDLEFFRYEGGL